MPCRPWFQAVVPPKGPVTRWSSRTRPTTKCDLHRGYAEVVCGGGGGVENFPPQNEFIGRPPPRQTRLVTLLEVKGGRWVYESKVLKSGLPLKSLIFRKAALGPLVILSCFFASDSPL